MKKIYICILQATIEQLKIFRDDHLLLKGRKRKDTVCIARASYSVGDHNIEMSNAVRKNLRVRLGDVIFVHACNDVSYGKRIHIF